MEEKNIQTPEKPVTEGKTSEHPYLLPIAIVVAGLVIGGAVLFADRSPKTGDVAVGDPSQQQATNETPNNARPVDASDHVLGSAAAAVTLIEYSDFQCPFCERLHPDLKRVMQEYSGKVRWAYRHFPLPMHPQAKSAAVATECAADLGGNDAFWKMSDALFAKQSELGEALYVQSARTLGLNEAQFKSCLNSTRFDARIDADTQDGVGAGASGTPYVVIMDSKGNATSFSGAIPYEQIKVYIDQALAQAGA